MAEPSVKPFTYTKDSGESSQRKLLMEGNHEIVTALDVTQDPNPAATQAAFAAYQKAFGEHKKSFPSFKDWAAQNGHSIAEPSWKSFKVSGLKPA
jgi:hypothetical protein